MKPFEKRAALGRELTLLGADQEVIDFYRIMDHLHPHLQAIVYGYFDGIDDAIERFRLQQSSSSSSSSCCSGDGSLTSEGVPRPSVLGTGPGVYATRRWWLMDSVLTKLEQRAEEIAVEYEAFCKSRLDAFDGIPTGQKDGGGSWRVCYLMDEGDWNSDVTAHFPVTTAALRELSVCECTFGYAYFSSIQPGTRIAPHYGPTNFKLRVQMPILPSSHDELDDYFSGCSITVGGATRRYIRGKTLIFDDSYLHSVINESDHERVVLLVDIWHPQLQPHSVEKLRSFFKPAAQVGIDDGHFPVSYLNSSRYVYRRMQNEDHLLLKGVCIGDSGVGKSSFIVRLADSVFYDRYMPTIGVDFKVCKFSVKGKRVAFQLWDVAGPERFRTITSSYYRGANIIFVMIDVTDSSSLRKNCLTFF